jgi:hypothetical protein
MVFINFALGEEKEDESREKGKREEGKGDIRPIRRSRHASSNIVLKTECC